MLPKLMFIDVQQKIETTCKELSEFLKGKNRKYGNSAIEPFNIFSKIDAIEKINVRIDDKLARIKNRQNDEDEDVEWDLIGYLILKRVFLNLQKKENLQKKKTVFAVCVKESEREHLVERGYYWVGGKEDAFYVKKEDRKLWKTREEAENAIKEEIETVVEEEIGL